MSARRGVDRARGGKKTPLGRGVGARNPMDVWLAGLCGAQEGDAAVFMQALAQARADALARTLAHASAHSSFYASRLAGHDLGAYCPENLCGLPFTTASDLARWQDFLCVSQGAVRRMVTLHTSGTTGQPKRLAFTDADLARTRDFFRAGISQLVSAGQTLAVLLPGAERPDGVADLLRQALQPCGIKVCCPPPHVLAAPAPEAETVLHTLQNEKTSAANTQTGEGAEAGSASTWGGGEHAGGQTQPLTGEEAQPPTGEESQPLADGQAQLPTGEEAQPLATGLDGPCPRPATSAWAPASAFATSQVSAALALWLAETGAHCLVAAPGQLEGLLRYFPNSGPPGLRGLLSSADRLDPVLRHVLASVWNCTVLDHYGLTEMGYGCAVECPAHDGYHLRALDMIVEIIDFCGDEPLPPGETGEVVITTLEREAMPLIRYRTGDVASLLPGPCACGSPLPRLGPVCGRLERCGGRVRVVSLPKGGRNTAGGTARQADTADAPHCLLGDWA